MPKPKLLFVLKQRSNYSWEYSSNYGSKPSGLLNSASFVAHALHEYLGFETKVVEVVDNNHIYKEINKFQPTHVIIEALWVVPSKFYELIPMYPHLKWVIRVHSKEVFLANEGIAIKWIREYQEIHKKYNQFNVSFNNKETNDNFKRVGIAAAYLPNIYFNDNLIKENVTIVDKHPHILNVGCFGAIRPMKNHLIQAMVAIEFADSIGKTLHFHINGSRIERGDEALKNLRALFDNREDGHKLVEHSWYPHAKFCDVISRMDLGMQVSLSESFNIVTADFVNLGIPIVVSEDIEWMPFFAKCEPTDSEMILRKLSFIYHHSKISSFFSKLALAKHNLHALVEWKHYFKRH